MAHPEAPRLRLRAVLLLLLALGLALAHANPVAQGDGEAGAPEGATTPPADVASATEGSKMARFLDEVSSAFKQGTAKMKEGLEIAASSVKDGVLQGYDYVRSKLTGDAGGGGPPDDAALTSTAPADADAGPGTSTSTTSTTILPLPNERPAISSTGGQPAFGGAIGVSNEPAQIVPNDDDDDERIIFNDKDYTAERAPEGAEDERDVTETPAGAGAGVTIDNRFIIASPLACKSGQEVVNGKCRNVF